MSMGTASTSPQKISEPTLTSKIPATPTGPGVGGTIVCVMTRPHARAMPIDTMDFRVSEEIALASGVRMMKPESQKIGIETRKPVMAMAISSRPLPKSFRKESAMRFAAPETSNSCPIMTPKPMMMPMLPSVPPNPLVMLATIC